MNGAKGNRSANTICLVVRQWNEKYFLSKCSENTIFRWNESNIRKKNTTQTLSKLVWDCGAGNRTRFAFLPGGQKLRSQLRPAEVEPQPTGLWHLNGFSSGIDTNKKEEAFASSFLLVPATGLEPVRFLRRGILSPLCLPISPCRHGGLVHISTFLLRRQVSRGKVKSKRFSYFADDSGE